MGAENKRGIVQGNGAIRKIRGQTGE